MADLTAADVTVNLTQDDIDRSPDRVGLRTFPSIVFGNGAKTYGSGNGIPLPEIGKFGLNFAIKRAYVEQPGDGYVYVIDRANHKLRIFQASHDLAIIGGAIPVEAIGVSGAGNDDLTKEAATNRTIAGATAATKGGVVPGPLVEVPATHAPAATTLYLELVGR